MVRYLSVPKYEGMNEDCWSVSGNPPYAGRIILCDGASESYASRAWANILCSDSGENVLTRAWLAKKIAEYEKRVDARNLSWSQAAAYERGSFSTFLSMEIKNGKCCLNVVGDTVAFAVNRDEIIDCYPYTSVSEFKNRPLLLSTKDGLNPKLEDNFDDSPYSGILKISGATHVLMLTDAIACWLMERKPDRIRELVEISNLKSFTALVERERSLKRLRFDDSTMILVPLSELALP